MKTRAISVILITIILQCCSPSTYITGSWKSPAPVKQYSNILIASLSTNVVAKATLETNMANALINHVSDVTRSIDEFPPGINGDDSSKVTIMDMVNGNNRDAILTISTINQETETRYVTGSNPYSPLGYPYYNDFWGYYSYWYPRFYNPGYYVQDKIYFIEVNLYDTQTEKLVWSAQSKTYNPDDLQSFSREFADVIADKLKNDGMISKTTVNNEPRLSKE